ncbi:MAG: fibronectin type III domain-containing protein [Candidatus Sungbacteria bacterium]|nr:fibronectin type III domain-containing protein [Candidatus Sungbacteria bacterium]
MKKVNFTKFFALFLGAFFLIFGYASVSTADTQAPTPPDTFSVGKVWEASVASSTALILSWSGATDNVGVTGYKIFRNSSYITSVTGLSYTDVGLSPGTTYQYYVKSYDAAGNESAAGATVSGDTAGGAVPAAPSGLGGSVSGSSVSLLWVDNSTNETFSYVGKRLSGGTWDMTVSVGANVTSYIFSNLSAGTYDFHITACNVVGCGSDSNTFTTTVIAATSTDTTAPSVPTGLTATAISSSQINLSWTASTDDVGAVTHYWVYKNDVFWSETSETSYSGVGVTGLSSNTTYSFYVKAVDYAGNVSPASTAVSATTLGTTADTQAPSIPSGVSATAVSSSQINLSWASSTDDVGVTGYRIYRGGTQIATASSTSYSNTGLTASTAYFYTVAAYDAAGNVSVQSSSASATTLSTSAAPSLAWVRLIGGNQSEYGRGTYVDSSGYIYVVGDAWSTINGYTPQGYADSIIAKYDSGANRLWLRMIGTTAGDIFTSVSGDSSGNVYAAGGTYGNFDGYGSNGSEDAVLVKYDSSGTKIWSKPRGTSGLDRYEAVSVDSSSGSIYAGGLVGGSLIGEPYAGANDAFLVKYASDGSIAWTRIFGTSGLDKITAIKVDGSSNIYVSGWIGGAFGGQSFGGGSYDAFVAKYSSGGDRLWIRFAGGSGTEIGEGIGVDSSGNSYLIGYTNASFDSQTYGGQWDIFVTKFDSSGNKIWTRFFGDADNELTHGGAVDSSGNVYVAGYYYGSSFYNQSNVGSGDIFLMKVDSSGNKVWSQVLGTSSDEWQLGMAAIDSSGNIYVAGKTDGALGSQTNAGSGDAFLAKFGTGGATTPPPPPPSTDTTAPSIPTGLSATAVSSSQINLSWASSTDNVGVTGYKVYRQGAFKTDVTGLSYSDTSVVSDIEYCYEVSAYDAAGNVSLKSSSVCAKAPISSGSASYVFISQEDASQSFNCVSISCNVAQQIVPASTFTATKLGFKFGGSGTGTTTLTIRSSLDGTVLATTGSLPILTNGSFTEGSLSTSVTLTQGASYYLQINTTIPDTIRFSYAYGNPYTAGIAYAQAYGVSGGWSCSICSNNPLNGDYAFRIYSSVPPSAVATTTTTTATTTTATATTTTATTATTTTATTTTTTATPTLPPPSATLYGFQVDAFNTFPQNGVTHIPTNAKIHVKFTKEIDLSSTKEQFFILAEISTPDLPISGSFQISGDSFEFTPSYAVKPGTTYIYKVFTTLKDKNGANLVSAFSASFTTAGQQLAGAIIEGVVKDTAGKSVAGAGIHIFSEDFSANFGGVSGNDGTFRISVSAGAYLVEAFSPSDRKDLIRLTPLKISIASGETKKIDIKFGSAVKIITGTVAFSDGTIINDAEIGAYSSDRGQWVSTFADSAGKYTLNVGGGKWQVGVRPKDPSTAKWSYAGIYTEVSFSSGGIVEARIVNIEIPLSLDAKLVVKAVDQDGKALADVGIVVDTFSAKASFTGARMHPDFRKTDSTGMATFNLRSATFYYVRAFLPPESGFINPGEEAVALAAAETKEIKLVFKKPDVATSAKINGITKLDDGMAIDAFIWAWSEKGRFVVARSSAKGEFAIGLALGDRWHIGAGREVGSVPYKAAEITIDVTNQTVDLEIILVRVGVVPLASSVSVSRPAAQSVVAQTQDGAKMSLPGGSAVSSGGVSVEIKPTVEAPSQAAAKVVSIVYDITVKDAAGKEVTALSQDAEVILPYNKLELKAQGVSEDNIIPSFLDEKTGAWVKIDNFTIDKEKNVVVARVNHLTRFAIVAAADVIAPSAPTGLNAAALGAGKIKVSWKNPSSDFDHAKIYRSEEKSKLGIIVSSETAGEEFIDADVTDGVLYYYTVRAVDPAGNESSNTNQASIRAVGTSAKPKLKTVFPPGQAIKAAILRELVSGSSGDDVKTIQELLVREGVYPEGLITGFFGSLTKQAVIRFQEKYSEDILKPGGLFKGTGVVGPATRKKINELLGGVAAAEKPALPPGQAIKSEILKTLIQGSSGDDVKTIQELLVREGVYIFRLAHQAGGDSFSGEISR